MYCRCCGKELPNDSNFCPNCGARQKEETIRKNSQSIITWFTNLLREHKVASYTFLIWFLLHLTLYISSEKLDNCDNRFYPFSTTFSRVLDNYSFDIDFLGRTVDYYNFTEFFAYVVLLPLLIWGIVRSYPYIKRFWSKMIIWINRWQEKNTKKAKDYQAWKEQLQQTQIIDNLQKVDINETANAQSPIEEVEQHHNTDTIDLDQDNINESVIIDTPQNVSATIECEPKEDGVKTMPLLRRFVGSMFDKIVIIIISITLILLIGSSSADYMGNLGKYSAFFHMSTTEVYNSAIGTIMLNFPSDRISQHQSEIDECYSKFIFIDIIYTFQFVIVNILYYYFSERKWNASPGKHLLGLVLVSISKKQLYYKIDNSKIMFRSIIFVLLMIIMLTIRWLIGINYYGITILFFLVLDIPVLFTGNSLIDILSRTKLIASANQKILTDNTN